MVFKTKAVLDNGERRAEGLDRRRAEKADARASAPDTRILVGVFGAPHGIRGELRLKSFTADPQAIGRYGPLSAERGGRRFAFANLRLVKDDMLVVRVEGVDDRTGAEALTNVRLFVERSQLPAPEPDEVYQADLIGLRADRLSGETLGRVVAVQNFGAGDLLEIAPPTGDTVLVPFTLAFVPELDVSGGRLVVADAALETGPVDPDDPDAPLGAAP